RFNISEVSVPSPGPISSTVSSAVIPALSATSPRTSRSVSQCWPSSFFGPDMITYTYLANLPRSVAKVANRAFHRARVLRRLGGRKLHLLDHVYHIGCPMWYIRTGTSHGIGCYFYWHNFHLIHTLGVSKVHLQKLR